MPDTPPYSINERTRTNRPKSQVRRRTSSGIADNPSYGDTGETVGGERRGHLLITVCQSKSERGRKESVVQPLFTYSVGYAGVTQKVEG
jgi:hypothetical protein